MRRTEHTFFIGAYGIYGKTIETTPKDLPECSPKVSTSVRKYTYKKKTPGTLRAKY